MQRLDPRGRAMLRTYRSAKTPPRDQRDGLLARIEASLDAGTPAPRVEPPSMTASAPAGAPAWAWPVVAVAVAAIVIAALALRPAGAPEHDPRRTPSGAPYDTRPIEPAATVPASGSGPATPRTDAPPQDDAAAPRTTPETPVVSASADERAPTRRRSMRDGDRVPASASEDPPSTEVDELRAELALIREARQALHAERPEGALEVLDAHMRAFPDGQMREDREVLRIEALCAAGKAPQARAEVRLFLRAFPGSAHAQRVRSICAGP